MGGYFTGKGKLVPDNCPAKILPCERFQTRKDIGGDILRGNLWGRSTHGTRSKVLLVYRTVYTSTCAREIPTHGTAGTAHTGTGWGRVSPVPVKYPPMELGSKLLNLQAIMSSAFRLCMHCSCFNILTIFTGLGRCLFYTMV